MDRHFYYVGIAFFGIVNGLFNQTWLLFALIHAQILSPALLFGSVGLTLMFASLMVSTATIILGGIPAAIYEHWVGAKEDFDRSLVVDLARGNRPAHSPGNGQFSQVTGSHEPSLGRAAERASDRIAGSQIGLPQRFRPCVLSPVESEARCSPKGSPERLTRRTSLLASLHGSKRRRSATEDRLHPHCERRSLRRTILLKEPLHRK